MRYTEFFCNFIYISQNIHQVIHSIFFAGEVLQGNKMDSNNLATVFAPNILHCIKSNSSKETADRAEDRIDIINVVRTLIDHHEDLYKVPAELLDEVYVHMMDSHPEALDELLSKRDISTGAEE